MRGGAFLIAWGLAVAALLMGFAPLGPTSARACEARRLAWVPVRLQAGHPLVRARLDGRVAWFVLDTGAERTLLTPDAVRRLGLRLDPWVGTTTIGIGGTERHANAVARSLTLAGVALRQARVMGGLSLSVGAIPAGRVGGVVVDGVLGRDLLARFDLALDFPAARVGLYRVRGCAGRFLPWSVPYGGVGSLPGYRAMLGIPVRADGVVLRAMIDTGSTGSLVSGAGMARLGWSVAGLAGAPAVRARGVGKRVVVMRYAHLWEMRVAGVAAREVPVVAAPVILTPLLDLLVGMQWLSGHLVWLSYATGQVFVAR